MTEVVLEICVDSAEGLAAAVRGGADRVELCSALALGGLTPSVGLMERAAVTDVPVFAMIRPRPGDFVYGESDVRVMLAEVDHARDLGLHGVVLGASLPDGALDRQVLERLVRNASGLGLTLHRAFDLTGPHFAEAIDIAVELGFQRILTSGGAVSAVEGLAVLADCFARAAGRIVIMPGAGIGTTTLPLLMQALPLTEVHSSASAWRPATNARGVALGFEPETGKHTDEARVRAMKAALAETASKT